MKQLIKYIKIFPELIISFLISREWVWKKINKSAIASFQASPPQLNEFEKKILNDIENDGFAVLNLKQFGEDFLTRLVAYKNELSPHDSNTKTFLLYYLGGMYDNAKQVFNKSNPLLELSLNYRLVKIINSYFKMDSRLTYLEINQTLVNPKEKAQFSQKFHKDPGIKKCLKVFVYLNDVTLDNGPFTYVKFSHKTKVDKFKQKRFGAGGIYPKQDDFENNIYKKDIIPIIGKAGTLIIADTTGLHCGGNSIKKSREMATMVYYPPGDLKKSKININIPGFDKLFPTIKYLIPERQRLS